MRADDGNRTRTVSLGICAIRRRTGPDLRRDGSVSDRERPLFTVVNGTLMARRGGDLHRCGDASRRPRPPMTANRAMRGQANAGAGRAASEHRVGAAAPP